MIIVDVETTGNDPVRNGLREIGAVDFSNPENRFSIELRTRADAEIDKKIQEQHGFKEVDFYNPARPSEFSAILLFNKWVLRIGDRTLGGMNPDFDEGFLMSSYSRYSLPWPFPYRKVDQHSLAYASMLRNGIAIPVEKHGSALYGDAIMGYVGIPSEPRPHKGINGAIWETEAISRLIYGRNILPEFSGCPVPDYLLRR